MVECKCEIPTDFADIWSIVQQLRITRDAPVDLWGCEKVVDSKAPKDVFEFQILLAAMLSSQTKDRSVKEAMDRLLVGDCSIGGVLNLTEAEIDDKIKSVGFHATKAKNIRAVAKILKDQFQARVPRNFDDLVSLPGIGPKMANLIMTCAFQDTVGICVDTHVHRICTHLGWGCRACKPMCKQPEHTRAVLESWVPNEMWRDFTYLLVGLGQQSQSARQLLLSRCMQLEDPKPALRLLTRIKFNFNGLLTTETLGE